MNTFYGVILIIFGVCLGLYAGIWWAFVGGIVDIINEIKADETEAVTVAIGIVKILFAGFIGYASAAIFAIPGYLMVCADE